MTLFQNAKWIFADTKISKDLYTEYTDTILSSNLPTTLYISADTDYTLRINGQYAASNQYGDFEHYKIYDTIDISAFLREGENRIDVTLYYCLTNTQRYRRADVGLIYEVWQGGRCICFSGTHTLSRKSPTYRSGLCRLVSPQLGYTFSYDAAANCDGAYQPSRIQHKPLPRIPRPIPKQRVCERAEIKIKFKKNTMECLYRLEMQLRLQRQLQKCFPTRN